ncbi:MAG: hypothetical protein CVU39_12310 [Chloroflexi bacterium HGW-Chloroflexi-10]|nr:MAG: hypothetical protein CVU39_12310 [Chloroflexi bacterium HGW-Chloroflexi-10]
MNILICTTSPFPTGTAGSVRTKTIAKLFKNNGHEVFVLSLFPNNEPSVKKEIAYKDYDGIKYRLLKTLNYPIFFTKRYSFLSYVSIFNSLLFARETVESIFINENIELVLFYSWSAIEIEPIVRIAKKHGIKTIADVVEWPNKDYFKWGYLNPLFWNTKRLLKHTYFCVDGVISISTYIKKQYETSKKTMVIPAIIDTSSYEKGYVNKNNNDHEFVISYLGSLFPKDDPLIIIYILNELLEKGYKVKVNIIGNIQKNKTSNRFHFLVKHYNISNVINFLGRLPDDILDDFLHTSDILLLPRQNHIGVVASFPTRIPELLMIGKPLVTSDVGDVILYLNDGEHAVIGKPGDYIDISKKIISLFNNIELREAMGNQGKSQAKKIFNYNHYSVALENFLRDL